MPNPQPTRNPRGAGRKPTGNARNHKIMIRLNEAEYLAYQQLGPAKVRELIIKEKPAG